MNDAKGGHTHGRKEEGGADSSGAPFTFFALCLAVALFTVLQVTPIAGHAQAAAGTPVSMALHGRGRKYPSPSSSCATCRLRIVWQRASSERRQSNSSSLQDKQKGGGGFHRAEGRRDGWKEGEWVVAVADAGHTALHAWHRWRPAAATMTHGAEYWGGLHFSTDFTRHARWTRPRKQEDH